RGLSRSANRNITVKPRWTLSAQSPQDPNILLLCCVWGNELSGKLPQNEGFGFSNNGTVQNRNPQPGEAAEYIPQFEGRTGALLVDYAMITVKPNLFETSKVMILAGVYSEGTEAAAEYVTNKRYVDQLNQRLKQVSEGAQPRSFQALLKVEVENGIPTTILILAVHALGPGA